ncbi:NUDIX domain-containing protein [Evansella sp. AB-rgal1]|uniref:NUDIX domain-containing protein n=1 Tax=Evansella sp. AB-rgal1 TaxID=3242696 RepID=UPI00359CEEAC
MNITIATGAIILNDFNQVLLVYRLKEPEANKWSIPGGKVELYEHLTDCVVREVKEEVNLDVEVDELVCTAETVDDKTKEHYISLIYKMKNVNGVPENMEQDKIGDLRWFSLEKLPDKIACFSIEALEITKKNIHFTGSKI